jgi:hypothetical protein
MSGTKADAEAGEGTEAVVSAQKVKVKKRRKVTPQKRILSKGLLDIDYKDLDEDEDGEYEVEESEGEDNDESDEDPEAEEVPAKIWGVLFSGKSAPAKSALGQPRKQRAVKSGEAPAPCNSDTMKIREQRMCN